MHDLGDKRKTLMYSTSDDRQSQEDEGGDAILGNARNSGSEQSSIKSRYSDSDVADELADVGESSLPMHRLKDKHYSMNLSSAKEERTEEKKFREGHPELQDRSVEETQGTISHVVVEHNVDITLEHRDGGPIRLDDTTHEQVPLSLN